MTIQTERLNLREVNEDDTQFIHTLNSIPEVDKYNTLGIPANISITNQLVADIINSQDAIPRIRYVFVIENKETLKPIGLCGLVIGKPKYSNAELWYKLHPDFWQKGYATEAGRGILDFGFKTLLLHRIEAGCATENMASITVLQKLGFTKEAHIRKLLPIRGNWVDNYGFAILEEDFLKN